MIVEVIGGADERPRRGWSTSTTSAGCTWRSGEVTDEEAAEVLERTGLGRLQDARHRVPRRGRAAGRRRAPRHGARLGERWDAMVAGARSKGWLSDDGASLQVHVESAAGA